MSLIEVFIICKSVKVNLVTVTLSESYDHHYSMLKLSLNIVTVIICNDKKMKKPLLFRNIDTINTLQFMKSILFIIFNNMTKSMYVQSSFNKNKTTNRWFCELQNHFCIFLLHYDMTASNLKVTYYQRITYANLIEVISDFVGNSYLHCSFLTFYDYLQ